MNQEHYDLLKQDIDAWNAWREQHPDIRPDLSGANLNGVDLSGANLKGASLDYTFLYRAVLKRASLEGANLEAAFLAEANFTEANLVGANLTEANLNKSILYRTNLEEANLEEAVLHGATVRASSLKRANLEGTILTETIFEQTNLTETILSDAQLGLTVFVNLDLRTVKGLETIEHLGPSTIGTDTIIRSEGNIPEVFLRGAGLDDTFISYVLSLTRTPIQHYSCFISYSSRNQEFAERLYNDLQGKGVRCWFAPEDLKTGDKFRQRIDESIRVYDKLLLVLSAHSVVSPWVEKEVETAFEKEHRTGSLVLFPVKLDESVMQTDRAWAADIRRQRHILDFTRWKEHDPYQNSLTRLLRDLKQQT